MLENLKRYKIVLASASPRRRVLLGGLGIDFTVRTIPGIDESFPPDLAAEEIPVYISQKKANAYLSSLDEKELLITADTIVWNRGKVLGKPESFEDAVGMLRQLSGHTHQVITGVCLLTRDKSLFFSVTSEVTFAELSEEEITYYVETYRPLDKAGAYGIQEWIGFVGVERISGSFYNVMGLPIQRLYQELKHF